MSQPPLIISALDAQRLRNMLDSGAHDHMPGVDALSDEIDRATIVEPQQVPPDVVTMNSTVRFINDSTGQEFQLKLVALDHGALFAADVGAGAAPKLYFWELSAQIGRGLQR